MEETGYHFALKHMMLLVKEKTDNRSFCRCVQQPIQSEDRLSFLGEVLQYSPNYQAKGVSVKGQTIAYIMK